MRLLLATLLLVSLTGCQLAEALGTGLSPTTTEAIGQGAQAIDEGGPLLEELLDRVAALQAQVDAGGEASEEQLAELGGMVEGLAERWATVKDSAVTVAGEWERQKALADQGMLPTVDPQSPLFNLLGGFGAIGSALALAWNRHADQKNRRKRGEQWALLTQLREEQLRREGGGGQAG